jgi:hypothetical protein
MAACQFGLMLFPDKAAAARQVRRVLASGGSFVFSVWDGLENNPLQKKIRETLSSMVPDPPPDINLPFSFNDQNAIRALLSEAGFEQIAIEVAPAEGLSRSPEDLAHGLVEGTRMVNFILQQDPAGIPKAREVVAKAIGKEFGVSPVRFPMQALICLARVPS